jgi:phosphoribosyl 1,2-cyclic phosphodiesterase
MQAYILDVPKLEVGGFEVSSFLTSHDSAASCGYRVSLPDNRQVAVCTDLGFVSTGVRQGITGCDAIVLESNHDVDMLKTGPYPYYLKERVLSRRGHLANETCAAELPRLIAQGTTRLVLAHLSQENNMPILARRTAVGALKDYGMQENKDYTLNVASPCGGQPILL